MVNTGDDPSIFFNIFIVINTDRDLENHWKIIYEPGSNLIGATMIQSGKYHSKGTSRYSGGGKREKSSGSSSRSYI